MPDASPSAARGRRRTATASIILVVMALAAVACNDDGRELREPRPDQTASISTVAPSSSGPEFVLPDLDDDPTASDSMPEPTLPGEPTVVAPWLDGATIPVRHTCGAENISPAVSWGPSPEGTAEIAVTLLDLDAPDFVHWVVAGIDPTTTALPEGDIVLGAVETTNGAGAIGYTGPCPPAGTTHTYLLTVHYLGEPSGASDGDPAPDVLDRIRSTVIATAELVGTSSRV